MADKEIIKKSISTEPAKVFLLDKLICNYINSEWIDDNKSNLSQSNQYGLHPHVLKKIRENDGYRIPMSTLAIICFYRKVSLSDFFKLIEEKYGSKINDDFVNKTKK
jgi:DNA-binding Xre family transcriptional regulator